MNGNGTAGFFIFLVTVLAVLGFGYLLNQANQDAVAILAHSQVEATLSARAATEEANANRFKTERDGLAATVTAMINEKSVLATQKADADRRAANSEKALATAQAAAALAPQATPEPMAVAQTPSAQIPATGPMSGLGSTGSNTGGTAEVSKVMRVPALSLVGISVFGIVMLFGVVAFGRDKGGASTTGRKPGRTAQYASDVTTVVMSVDEAREYARRKSGRAKTQRRA